MLETPFPSILAIWPREADFGGTAASAGVVLAVGLGIDGSRGGWTGPLIPTAQSRYNDEVRVLTVAKLYPKTSVPILLGTDEFWERSDAGGLCPRRDRSSDHG